MVKKFETSLENNPILKITSREEFESVLKNAALDSPARHASLQISLNSLYALNPSSEMYGREFESHFKVFFSALQTQKVVSPSDKNFLRQFLFEDIIKNYQQNLESELKDVETKLSKSKNPKDEYRLNRRIIEISMTRKDLEIKQLMNQGYSDKDSEIIRLKIEKEALAGQIHHLTLTYKENEHSLLKMQQQKLNDEITEKATPELLKQINTPIDIVQDPVKNLHNVRKWVQDLEEKTKKLAENKPKKPSGFRYFLHFFVSQPQVIKFEQHKKELQELPGKLESIARIKKILDPLITHKINLDDLENRTMGDIKDAKNLIKQSSGEVEKLQQQLSRGAQVEDETSMTPTPGVKPFK